MVNEKRLSRRDFLKWLSLTTLGGVLVRPWSKSLLSIPDFPQADRLGRVCVGKVEVKARPDEASETVAVLYEDSVVPWIRERIGRWPFRNNQKFVETPQGYIWSPYLQPVENRPNVPVESLPTDSKDTGMWVEVTVPWVDVILDNPPPRSHWLRYRAEHGLPPRMYYSQILWIDRLKKGDNGQVWYRINERYGNPGDIFWGPAEAFRPLTQEEILPINPDSEEKRVVVNVNWHNQTLSCLEGNREVYYCRVSSGVQSGSTPVTPFGSKGYPIWRKLYSIHMAGGTNEAGWDLIGIGWTSLFVGEGVALHSTFWHNNFGEPMSHGCVNLSPEDAKWIFRWTLPVVPYETGDITIVGEGSTKVIVVDD